MEYILENWQLLVQILTAILLVLGGKGGVVYLIQQLKEAMNLSGFPAQVLAAAVSVILAGTYLIVSGEIIGSDLRLDNIVYLTTAVYGLATALYHQIKRKGKVDYHQIL